MAEIMTFCLSRGRPNKLKEMIGTWQETHELENDFYVILDSDDEHNYERIDGITYIVFDKNEKLSVLLNNFINIYVNDYKYFQIASDDVGFVVKGWDRIFSSILNDHNGWGIVYGIDTVFDTATHPMISHKIIKSLGYIAQPNMYRYYIDIVLHQVCTELNMCYYVPQVFIEHKHFSLDQNNKDYAKLLELQLYYSEIDLSAFRKWTNGDGKIKDIQKIIKAMEKEKNE